MTLALWIAFGIAVGAVARWVVPGEAPAGVLGDLLTGAAGAVIGGLISALFGHAIATNLGGFVCALIGAVVLLRVVRAAKGRREA